MLKYQFNLINLTSKINQIDFSKAHIFWSRLLAVIIKKLPKDLKEEKN